MSPEFFRVHHDLDREGPGSEASTLRALAACGPLPGTPRVLDLGCGPGASALTLARALPAARIVAVDTHRPFLDRLAARAAAAGLGERITPWHGSMIEAPGPADLFWSEGAAYCVGVEAALRRWRDIAAPGARVAFSELVWLTDTPSPVVRADLEAEYPAIGDIATTRARVEAAGWRLLDDFVLPPEDWANYYGPMRARVARLRAAPCTPALRAELDAADFEADLYDRYGSEYGYVFVIARLPETPGA